MAEARIPEYVFLQSMNIIHEALALKDEPSPVSPTEIDEDEDEMEEEEQKSGSISRYQDSDSPSEYWDEDQEEWPIKGIVGEEVTTTGELKSVPRLHLFSSGVCLS